MCGQCLAGTKDICEVIPGYKLVVATQTDGTLTAMEAGDYGLVNLDVDQCPEFVFKKEHKPAPCRTGYEVTDSDNDENWTDQSDDEMWMVAKFGRCVLAFAQNLHEVACLIETCIRENLWSSEAGYFENWLANRVGTAIKKYEETGEVEPIAKYQQPEEDNVE